MAELTGWELFHIVLCICCIYYIAIPGNRTRASIEELEKNYYGENDYNHTMSEEFEFRYVNDVCSFRPMALIVVFSHPKNYAERKAIRESWGKGNDLVKVIFAIDNDVDFKKVIKKEHLLYNDIIQGNNTKDTFQKYIMSFKYALYNCVGVKYVLKVNDNVFVNVKMLRDMLAHKIIFRRGITNMLILSKEDDDITKEEQHYDSWAVLYSIDLVQTLYKELQKEKSDKFTFLEVTGTILKEVPTININKLTMPYQYYENIVKGSEIDLYNVNFVFVSNVENEYMKLLWDNLKFRNVKIFLRNHRKLF